jgi:8-oxo-dGTP pyrophosphatase MutT (NUDIX family)
MCLQYLSRIGALILSIKPIFNTGLPEKLKTRLLMPLPGRAAQQAMAPEGRSHEILSDAMPFESAVLILLRRVRGDWKVVFIRRADDGRVHSGQIAFPGGRREPADGSLWETARREAGEEIGLNCHTLEPLGELTPLYIPHSNYLVHGFIALGWQCPAFIPQANEVADIFEVSLKQILKKSNRGNDHFAAGNGQIIPAPCFIFGQVRVWGATAMILSEFCALFDDLS